MSRGGSVISDGVLYYAAGIWPSEGIFLFALDPKTGRELWVNDDSGSIYMPQPHGGAEAESGVAAQGHLAASLVRPPTNFVGADGKSEASAEQALLLVPTGRAVPAVFDQKMASSNISTCKSLDRRAALQSARERAFLCQQRDDL